jgi:hypothetical protein
MDNILFVIIFFILKKKQIAGRLLLASLKFEHRSLWCSENYKAGFLVENICFNSFHPKTPNNHHKKPS